MNRIHQTDPATSTGKAGQLFTAVQGKLGFVPNLMRVLGNSPAALEGYLNLSGALAVGVLALRLREQIALAVGEINGCGYCLSAHTLLGGKAGLAADEILAARKSNAADSKSDAALKLARAVTLQRGMIADTELQAARARRLERCGDRRGRPARRSQHPDQLHQQRRSNRHRLPRSHSRRTRT
jgi:AhpD family alkylhydroperoxidase